MVFAVVSLLTVGLLAFLFSTQWLWLLLVLLPIILLGFYDMVQKKHAIMRNFPILGRGRYIMEWLRPKMYQYFIEPDTDGRPFNRINRSMVYQRAKKVLDTAPFGTQLDAYAEGYEWMEHSITPLHMHGLNHDIRITVGGPDCTQPYNASILNVSAMSYGSLSKAAVLALNGGAKIGGFAQNTGEGGISPYHLENGGDIIFQVGTGYFGCRTEDGNFDIEIFAKKMQDERVKMAELKLSQGAKPGHGGILPAKKNTAEIAAIRHVKEGTEVISPPYHKAFNTPIGLLEMIAKMRIAAGGKPVGFKLCIGSKRQFFAICKAMVETKLLPDFITIDGGEGGTGAAPPEFSNSVGMPYRDALAFAYNALVGFGLKEHIKLFASGKITNGFDMYRAFALGADACYSARAMMMAVGCIQALECNLNTCPTGVATQDPELIRGLVVADKKVRVANFHEETMKSFAEMLAAAGQKSTQEITRHHVHRRITMSEVRSYAHLYPYVPENAFLDENTVPGVYLHNWKNSSADSF